MARRQLLAKNARQTLSSARLYRQGKKTEDDNILHHVNAESPPDPARFYDTLGPDPTSDRCHCHADRSRWLTEIMAKAKKDCGQPKCLPWRKSVSQMSERHTAKLKLLVRGIKSSRGQRPWEQLPQTRQSTEIGSQGDKQKYRQGNTENDEQLWTETHPRNRFTKPQKAFRSCWRAEITDAQEQILSRESTANECAKEKQCSEREEETFEKLLCTPAGVGNHMMERSPIIQHRGDGKPTKTNNRDG